MGSRTYTHRHSNADEGGQKRGELTAFLEQPGGSGAVRVGEVEFNRESVSTVGTEKRIQTGSEAAPGRISGADKKPQPH